MNGAASTQTSTATAAVTNLKAHPQHCPWLEMQTSLDAVVSASLERDSKVLPMLLVAAMAAVLVDY
jgi:hypothetical protein